MAHALVDHDETKTDIMYACNTIVMGVRGFDAIGEVEARQFHEHGFLIVRDAFTWTPRPRRGS